MREVGIYKGKEITEEHIDKLKDIIATRTTHTFYKSVWFDIKNVEQMAYYDKVSVEEEHLALGKDWFLCYSVSNNSFTFLEWAAIEEESNRLVRTLEMMNTFKKLILQYKDKKFMAYMRHNTSFQFYSEIKKRGYFEELSHYVEVGRCNIFLKMKLKLLERNYGGLKKFLDSDDVENYTNYLPYIFHSLVFNVNNVFPEKSSKLIKKL